ncbi:MAG TPA: tripartite tricarboxylate transporter TctB family protein [Candidatus Methylomirabilis sp.]|jgi:hypothetical protein
MAANLRTLREFRGGLALSALATAYLVYGARYPVDTLANPGPGIFPRAAGALVLALAAWQAVRAALALRRGRPAGTPPLGPGIADPPPRQADERKPLLMVAILVVYLLVVSGLGFLASTAIVVMACTRLMGTPGWRTSILLALGAALGCYVLFEVWLKVPLPRGLLI